MANFTPTSSAGFYPDGSIGVGVEVVFDQLGQPAIAEQSFPVPNVNAYELYGTLAMRSEGKADVLARLYLDSRMILNANLKTYGQQTGNVWCYVAPAGLQTPASQLKVHIEAAGAGNAWPINCEIELCGRWS